jgi:hypothetical protein
MISALELPPTTRHDPNVRGQPKKGLAKLAAELGAVAVSRSIAVSSSCAHTKPSVSSLD